jgi:hypothetical protein
MGGEAQLAFLLPEDQKEVFEMKNQRIRVVVGHGETVEDALAQLQAENVNASCSIVFADAMKDQKSVAESVQRTLGGTTWGMSSAGEMSHKSKDIVTGSVAIMSFEAPQQKICFGAGASPIGSDAESAGESAAREAISNLNFRPEYLYLGMLRRSAVEMIAATPFTLLVGHDGHTFVEEDTIRGIANIVGRGARVVGGSAADSLSRFEEPRVYLNGRVLKDEIGIVAFATSLKNGTGMANCFSPVLDKGAFITSSKGRKVQSFDGRPAAEVYCELTGAKTIEEAKNQFLHHPLGLLDATSGYWQVRSPADIGEDGSMSFFSAVPPGIGLTLLKGDAESRVTSVQTALERAWIESGRPKRVAAVVLFNCILCHLHGKALACSAREVQAVQDCLRKLTGEDREVPMIGLSTFGETGATITGALGHHNQTVTAWLLGDEMYHEVDRVSSAS